MPEKKRRKINSGAVLRIFWGHTKKYPVIFSFAILGGVISQASNVIGPLFMRDLFNLLATLTPSVQTMQQITAVLVIYALVSLIGWFGGRLEMWLGYTAIAKVTSTLTKEAFQNLMHHSYQFFSSSFTGALTRRVGRFGGAYENLYYSLVTTVFQSLLYVAGIAIVLMYRNWILGSIVVFWVLLFIFVQWWLARWQQPLRLARAQEDTNLTSALADSISNQNTVALFGGNPYEETLVSNAVEKFERVQLRAWNVNTLIFGIQGLLSIFLNIGMLWVGVSLWQKGIITLGDVVLIQAYVFGIFNSVWNLGRQFHIIYSALADASEMVDIIQTPLGVTDKKGARNIQVEKGEIAFENVSFYFNETSKVLENLNLTIPEGQRVALVGPSGAGKSTLTKLLLRLFDLESGSISIDGQNIAKVTQDSLRNAIGFVPQEPILFHRTLMENIRYGRRDATDEEVVEAAKQAHCHEFISKLSLGYETFVGERGIKLSGGERQRVAIARAILKNAPILILDEATSSLDSESEQYIQEALEVLMRGKTVMVIAHRLSTIMKMDRIVVLEEGKVVADGTHDELLKEGGLYNKLWSIQAGGFIGGDTDAPETKTDSEEAESEEEIAQ